MRIIKQMGLGEAKKAKDKTKKLMSYSKQWNPGDTMRLQFPIEWTPEGTAQIVTTVLWGHQVNNFNDINLKTTLIPSLTEFDENGSPIGRLDVTYQFANIAPIFVKTMKQREMERLASKPFGNETLRQNAMRDLEYKYDSKNNPKAIKPAIARASMHIFTEVCCYKLNNEVPDPDSAAVVSFRLSGQRIDQILAIFNTPKFAPQPGDEFWEIEWKYVANPDKNTSGRNSNPSGLTNEYRTAVQFPEEYKRLVDTIRGVSHSSETMYYRAVKEIEEAKIAAAISQYCIMNSEYLDGADEEDVETLVKNATLVHELNVDRSLQNAELLAKIQAKLQSEPAPASTPEMVPDLGAPAVPDLGIPTPAVTPTVPDLSGTQVPELNPQAPTMDSLMNNQAPLSGLGAAATQALHNPNFSADNDMEDVDLSAM